MKFFTRCTNTGAKTLQEFIEQCRSNGYDGTLAQIKTAWDRLRRCEDWMDETYHVSLDKETEHGFEGMTIWHLSIKRHDKEPFNDWRELQEIKNAICGSEVEAIQLYPAESRLVDTSNQYHLFAFMNQPGSIRPPTIPVGFTERSVTDTPFKGGKQRPRTP